MNISELETRLKRHAEVTKAAMHSPFDTERKEIIMTKKNHTVKKITLLAAALLCLIGTTVFAAVHLLNAGDAASVLGDSKLAQYFRRQGTVCETITDGDYRATVLGIASGKNLSSLNASDWELSGEKTYAVVAVEHSDGSPMTYDDEILVTPLIQGLKPWQYNIFTMNGGYTAGIIDGVLYRIIEFDSIEYFADREVYMAVLSEPFLNNQPYSFDEATGKIAAKEDFDGTNILIKLELDSSKADPEKAQEYLNRQSEADTGSAEEPEDTAEPGSETETIEIYDSDRFHVELDENAEEPSLIITDKQ